MTKTAGVAFVEACKVEDVECESVVRLDFAGRTFAVFRSIDGQFYATDGYCTHEKAHLADGLVIDNVVECPRHNGRFDYTTGHALGAPVCVNLKTYATRIEAGKVLIAIA